MLQSCDELNVKMELACRAASMDLVSGQARLASEVTQADQSVPRLGETFLQWVCDYRVV